MLQRRHLIAGGTAALAAWGAPAARAQDPAFPTRPVRLLVGIPAGGAPDVIARILAERLSTVWRQPVVVDNRGAASGNLAAQAVAQAEPDGHTLLFAHASLILLNDGLMRDVPFNVEADFAPISLLIRTPFMVASRAALPADTLGGLRDYARGRPEGLTFATLSATGLPRFVGERIKAALGVPLVNVPYTTMAGAVQDTIAGRVDLLIDGTPVITPQLRAGGLKALAITSPERFAGLEGVPTAAESIPGFTSRGWFGLMGPSAMPRPLVARIAEDVKGALAAPDLRARLRRDFGAETAASAPAEFAASLAEDRAVYRALIREVGASIE